ncbi:hypothetical protein TIFTF001_023368 [Ficus carica]|uniref:Uncharacterized protein n=1 Tax=Ficus carica TaxID=3494 RepID=A0AA88DDN2_FICCA|nr:hypothetical protein TIFTF001_023368 [Ficus carica]
MSKSRTRTPGEKMTRGLHVQDRSEIAASPPFALIPSSVSAERELGKEIQLSVWPLFALSHHFVVWYCADKVYPEKKFNKYALLDNELHSPFRHLWRTKVPLGVSFPKAGGTRKQRTPLVHCLGETPCTTRK